MTWLADPSVARLASLAVFAISVWSVWTRRLSLRSRFDAGTTSAVALFGVGALLDGPWPVCIRGSEPVIGRFYGLMALGQISYLLGVVAAISSVYVRLLPDGEYKPFMRTRILPVAVVAVSVMVVSFMASSVPLTPSVPHLYLAVPDRALRAYWIADYAAATTLAAVLSYGLFLLRKDPRMVMARLMLGSAIVAALGCGLVLGSGVVTAAGYLGMVGYAVSAAIQWRHRERQLRSSRATD